jgi:hypothetical protein
MILVSGLPAISVSAGRIGKGSRKTAMGWSCDTITFYCLLFIVFVRDVFFLFFLFVSTSEYPATLVLSCLSCSAVFCSISSFLSCSVVLCTIRLLSGSVLPYSYSILVVG